MRTTFYEMHLFNNSSLKHDTSFILNRKEWGKKKTKRKRERKDKRVRDGVLQ